MNRYWVIVALCGLAFGAQAQEELLPYFERVWNEGDGVVALSASDLETFGQSVGRLEIDFTPGQLHTTGDSLRILDIPNHLGVWVWDDGIHGEWYNDADERRLYRTRWGLPANGVEVKIVITWDQSGYAVLVDGVVRIHDWQTTPTTVFPDPDIVNGVYGAQVDGSQPSNGTFKLRTYDLSQSYNGCSVDVVGTINANVPLDNTGSWDQGIDPACENPTVPPGTNNPPTISWTLPIENEDGTPLENLAGVRIFRQVHDTEDPTVTSWTGDWLPPGEYRYVSTAYNTEGVESVFSNDAFQVIGPLEVSDDKAYTVAQSGGNFVAFIIGTVPVGTECDENSMVKGLFNFLPFTGYSVPVADVTITGNTEPVMVVAVCH